jgi:hypothetical protein
MTEEKRIYPRQSKNGQVHVDVLNTESGAQAESVRYEGAMRDVSQNGIRLHGKHPIEKGANLSLVVEFESNHQHYTLSGSVRWVTETTEHEFVAGLELSDSVSTDIESWRRIFN